MKDNSCTDLVSKIGKELINSDGNIYGLFGRILEVVSTVYTVRFGRISLDSFRNTGHAIEVSHCGPGIDMSGILFQAEMFIQEAVERAEPLSITRLNKNCIPEQDGHDGLFKSDIDLFCAPIVCNETVAGTICLCVSCGAGQIPLDIETIRAVSIMISRFIAGSHDSGISDQITLQPNRKLSDIENLYDKTAVLIGNSSEISEIDTKINHFSAIDDAVILYGESGTGREHYAELIHKKSKRGDKVFITVRLASLPENMIEPDIFGVERNNPWGANKVMDGRIDYALGGTLYLDEISCLPLTAQARLVRLLRRGEFARVGSSNFNSIDVRIIASTACDLNKLLTEMKFNEELFYLLNANSLFLTPLRGRKSDIVFLADYFLEKYSSVMGKKIHRFSPEALDLLISHYWPGNIHELEDCIERSVIHCDCDVIRYNHLPPSLQKSSDVDEDKSLEELVGFYEKEIIVDCLKQSSGNISDAARRLKTTKRILGYKIQRLGIDYKQFLKS